MCSTNWPASMRFLSRVFGRHASIGKASSRQPSHQLPPIRRLRQRRPSAWPTMVAYLKWRLGDLPELLGEGGKVATRISQQWVISVYTEWEEHYRQRISDAMGLSEPLKLPPFGDLRHFRNNIVHHRGIATAATRAGARSSRAGFGRANPCTLTRPRLPSSCERCR